jgi:cytochrome P450
MLAWLILGYRPARQILAGPGWPGNPLANPNSPAALRAAGPDTLRRNILFTDGVDHQRIRGAVRDFFTRNFIAGLRNGTATIAADTIDSLPAGTEFDFMADIALSLPLAVASAWMGLDIATARLLRDESPASTRMLTDSSDAVAVAIFVVHSPSCPLRQAMVAKPYARGGHKNDESGSSAKMT